MCAREIAQPNGGAPTVGAGYSPNRGNVAKRQKGNGVAVTPCPPEQGWISHKLNGGISHNPMAGVECLAYRLGRCFCILRMQRSPPETRTPPLRGNQIYIVLIEILREAQNDRFCKPIAHKSGIKPKIFKIHLV